MCDEKDKGLVAYTDLTRRAFATLSAAAAGAAMAGCASAQPITVAERDVSVQTPDGTVEAALFHPEGAGAWPGVLFWPDIGGLRPAMRDMGRRLAGSGYVVLVVNPFYRSGTAAQILTLGRDMEKRMALRGVMTPAAIERDSKAFVAYLDAMQGLVGQGGSKPG